MQRVLVVHHTDYHFETALALCADLRGSYSVNLWSKSLSRWGRQQLVEELALDLYSSEAAYDLAVIVTADVPLDSANDPSLAALLETLPAVQVWHRFRPVRQAGELFLFPKADKPFLPVSVGLPAESPPRADDVARSFLVQGNIEPRRGYDGLHRVAAAVPDAKFTIIGKRTGYQFPSLPNVVLKYDLAEKAFHEECLRHDFILPLLEPGRNQGYFDDRFSSSIQRGFSANLPFVAHDKLMSLYNLPGISYKDEADFIAALKQASRMPSAELSHLREKIRTRKEHIRRENLSALTTVLNEAVSIRANRAH